MTPTIILSSHVMGLGLIRALGKKQVPIIVVYYDKQDVGYVSKYVIKSIYAPHPEKYEQQFIDLLIELADTYKDSLLVPTDDQTLYAVSKNKITLQKYYNVACTEWEITQRYIDKSFTYSLAESIGIPAPKTKVLYTVEDAETFGRTVEYPCIIKPCLGHRYYEIFARKMVMVNDYNQMMSEFHACKEHDQKIMLQEFIPGDDTHGVNYNSYFVNGTPQVEFTAEKLRLAPPKFGVPRVLISKEIPEILEPGRKLLKTMGFYGYSCTEFKKDERTGIYKLMEVNGRINVSIAHATRCGINFPWIMYNHLINNKLDVPIDFEKKVFWIDSTKDLITYIKYRKTESLGLVEFLKPYFKKKACAIFNKNDIQPFLKRWNNIVKKIFKKQES